MFGLELEEESFRVEAVEGKRLEELSPDSTRERVRWPFSLSAARASSTEPVSRLLLETVKQSQHLLPVRIPVDWVERGRTNLITTIAGSGLALDGSPPTRSRTSTVPAGLMS